MRRVGVPADKQRLDKTVQATLAQVRRHSWRRNTTVPADKQRLDKNVQATLAQVRRHSWRRNTTVPAEKQHLDKTVQATVASASPPISNAWTRLSKPRSRRCDAILGVGCAEFSRLPQSGQNIRLPPCVRQRGRCRYICDATKGVAPRYAHDATKGVAPSYAHDATKGVAPSYAHDATKGVAPSYAHDATNGVAPSYAHDATNGVAPLCLSEGSPILRSGDCGTRSTPEPAL